MDQAKAKTVPSEPQDWTIKELQCFLGSAIFSVSSFKVSAQWWPSNIILKRTNSELSSSWRKPFQFSRTYENILLNLPYFTILISLPKLLTAMESSEIRFNEVFSYYSLCGIIVSGVKFISRTWLLFCSCLNINVFSELLLWVFFVTVMHNSMFGDKHLTTNISCPIMNMVIEGWWIGHVLQPQL